VEGGLDRAREVHLPIVGPRGARTWVNKEIRDSREFPNLIFVASEISSGNAPYRYRQLRNDIDEALFDISEMCRLAKQYFETNELAEDHKPGH
jgi:hypothetical protein